MNNLLELPVGLDNAIQGIQEDIYEQLPNYWNNTPFPIVGYGRVQRTPLNEGKEQPEYYTQSKTFLPEWYDASIKNYRDVFWDTKNGAQFCFLIDEEDKALDEQTFLSKVTIVFWVNLERIYPIKEEQTVSRAHRDVMEVLRNYNFRRYQINNIERGVDNIFRQYLTKNMRYNDMHPLHCFAVNVDLTYYLTDKCT